MNPVEHLLHQEQTRSVSQRAMKICLVHLPPIALRRLTRWHQNLSPQSSRPMGHYSIIDTAITTFVIDETRWPYRWAFNRRYRLWRLPLHLNNSWDRLPVHLDFRNLQRLAHTCTSNWPWVVILLNMMQVARHTLRKAVRYQRRFEWTFHLLLGLTAGGCSLSRKRRHESWTTSHSYHGKVNTERRKVLAESKPLSLSWKLNSVYQGLSMSILS